MEGKLGNLFCPEEYNALIDCDTKLDGKYIQKTHSPIYTPRNTGGKGIEVWEMVDTTKYDRLVNIINASNVSKEQKRLLCLSATRFIEFNYESIADYYCQQDVEMQKLMEMLAMVIIDFDDAISNGFVELNDKMRVLYEREKKTTNG